MPEYPASASAAASSPGIYLPPNFGAYWRPKRTLALAGTGVATVAVAGDSVGRGYYSSNLNTKSWAGLVRIALQAAYHDGGSGYVGVQDTNTIMTSLGVNSAGRTAYASQQPTTTGTWASSAGFGIGNVYLYSATAASTVTFSVRGTSVSIYAVTNSGTATAAWTIDGAAQTPFVTNAASGIAKATATVTAGTHTVVVTAPGTATLYMCGASGQNASGIVVNNFSTFGAQTADFNNTDSFGGVANWSGGQNYPADLNIYALSVNSAAAGVAADTWEMDVSRNLQAIMNVSAPASDLLILMNHIGSNDNATPAYQNYIARARGLAEGYGAGLIDLWRLGQNSFKYWLAKNYWAVEDGSGAPGSSSIHPGDLGHAYIASVVLSVLQS